jgi:ornithine carbamoyltransferase
MLGEHGVTLHFLNFKELTGKQLLNIVDLAIRVKRHPQVYLKALQAKSAALVFQKTSTRTRVAFEVAMTQLGGHALYVDWRTTNFTLADIADETRYLSRNVDFIMARLLRHEDLQRMAQASKVPVINGCDEKYHPTQAIADLMTMKEKKGTLQGTKLVYVGIHNNVCNSLIEGCVKTGVKITTVTPLFHEPARDDTLLSDAKKTGLWTTTLDAEKAVRDADFVYTDTWVDMEHFTDPTFAQEKSRREKLMQPYQVNKRLLSGSHAYVMHDMPIHRGYEIADEVVLDPNSVIFEQAENRLYAAKAVLLTLAQA